MTDPTITIAGLRAKIEREYYREQACTMAGEIVELQAERRGHAAERQSLTAERDALAAQLAEVRADLDAAPKVCAIHSYEHGPGPCMTCGAWPPGTRELIAACQARIAGLEQAANERSRTGQMPESERAEWISAAVAVADALGGSLGPVSGTSGTIDPREWIHFAAGLADRAKKLTARMAELEARPVLTHEILSAAIKKARKVLPYIARQAADEYMPHLGTVTLLAQDRAEELCRAYHERAADMDGHMVGRWQYHGPESQAICTEAMERALASLGAPPTSPTVAPPEVFAGASVEELVVQYLMAGDPGLDPDITQSMVSGPRRAGVAAVLARLKVTLVAPEFLRRIPLYTKHGPGGKGDPGICDAACVKCEAERIIARLTAGVPVTPERK